MKKNILLLMAIVVIHLSFAQTQFTPSDAGSKIQFTIRNFGIKTGGDFTGIKGIIIFDPVNFSTSVFDVREQGRSKS